MSNPPGPPPKPDEGTVIIPAGQSGRPSAEASPASDVWDEEATRVVDPPSPAPPPVEPPPDAWSGRSDLPAGTVLGNYSVGKIIARGGLGAIYDGENIHNPAERVAIKTILPEPGMSERFGRMLLDEANALMRVRHDAVVPYRTYGRIAGTDEFYLVLEFIEGDTLNEFYRRRKLTEPELFALARRLAAGLQASHVEGLVHRDVSPDNVLLQANALDKATLIDFGIAKIGGAEDQPDTQFAGKLSYAAPEQFTPGGRIGPWTDIYSLALLLIAAARGKPLPMGATIEEAQSAREQVPQIDGVPPRLVGTLRAMLEPHPPDRPQSMNEVLALLDAAAKGGAAHVDPPPPVPPSSAPSAVPAPPATSEAAPRKGVRRIERPVAAQRPSRRRAGGYVSAVLALLIGGGAAGALMLFEEQIFGKPPAGVESQPASPSSTTEAPPPPASPEGPVSPPQPDPEPEKPRAEQLADIMSAFAARLSPVPCSVTRISGGDTGRAFTIRVHGIWTNAGAIAAAAKSASAATGVDAALSGELIEGEFCPAVEALKPLADRLAIPALQRPVPTGDPDRSAMAEITVDPAYPAILLLEVTADQRLDLLADIGTEISQGRLVPTADGRVSVRLLPANADANVEQTLLIVVESSAPLDGGLAPPVAAGLADWVAAFAQALGSSRLTLMPRDGVASGPAPPPAVPDGFPPVESPPTGTDAPDVPVPSVDADVMARISAIDCSLIRAQPGDGEMLLNGVWGKPQLVQALADTLGQERSTRFTLSGDPASPGRCTLINALKPFFKPAEPATLSRPKPVAPGGTSLLAFMPDKTYAHAYLIWADSADRVRGLLDIADPAALSQAIAQGRIAASGNEGYAMTLPRYSPDPAADSGAIILVHSDEPLPPEAFTPSRTMTLKAWTAQLDAAALRGRMRLDLVEYAQAPPA